MQVRFPLAILLLILGYVSRSQTAPDTLALLPADSLAPPKVYLIRNISVAGNKRTKIYIVQREIAFETGNTYLKKDFDRRVQLTKEQLMNTSLFVSTEITAIASGTDMVDLVVEVKERWYLFPVPYFKVIDRNWNEWIHTYGASLTRVNYGLKVSENNLSGRNDKLNIWLIGGYTQQISFNYTQPYIDAGLKQGMFFGFQYARNREVNYATNYDTLQFVKLPEFARTIVNANIGYTYRKGSQERHSIRLSYSSDKMDSAVVKLNHDFFGGGVRKVSYADISYTFQYFNVDYIKYPLRGWYVDVYASKRFGKTLDAWSIGGKYLNSWKLFRGNYFMLQAAASVKLPFDQPYYNSHLLGYGDLSMRGLEYVVVDGVAGGCLKATLRQKVFGFTIKNVFKTKSHDRIPFTFYAKAFCDGGYVYSRNTTNNSRLTNKLIRTGGFGLDIVTIYDLVLKLDVSFNQLGSQGFYYHTGSDF